MRRLWAAALAVLSTLTFLIVTSPPASAFGSEVLGCSVDSATWTANSCSGQGVYTHVSVIHFVPHNLSGSYTKSWLIAYGSYTVTGACGTGVYPCISSGCTASSTTCDVQVMTGTADRVITGLLTLTQSGQTRSYQANATIYGDDPRGGCHTC